MIAAANVTTTWKFSKTARLAPAKFAVRKLKLIFNKFAKAILNAVRLKLARVPLKPRRTVTLTPEEVPVVPVFPAADVAVVVRPVLAELPELAEEVEPPPTVVGAEEELAAPDAAEFEPGAEEVEPLVVVVPLSAALEEEVVVDGPAPEMEEEVEPEGPAPELDEVVPC